MRFLRQCPFRLYAAVAVFAVGLSTGAEAVASCGDYLHSPDAAASPRSVELPTPKPTPICHGPGCRNAPQPAPQSLPVTAPVRLENLFAAITVSLTEPPVISRSICGEESLQPPVGHRLRVDRPPRPSV